MHALCTYAFDVYVQMHACDRTYGLFVARVSEAPDEHLLHDVLHARINSSLQNEHKELNATSEHSDLTIIVNTEDIMTS